MENITHNSIDGRYIKDWLALGPFFSDDIEADSTLSLMAIEKIEPREDDAFTTDNGKILKWKRLIAQNRFVYLIEFLGDNRDSFAYVFCAIQSESDCETEINIISENNIIVWINGEQIYSYQSVTNNYLLPRHKCFSEIKLKKGANHCFIKLFNDEPDQGFETFVKILNPNRAVLSGAITDESGNPIPEADVCLEQTEETLIQKKADASGKYILNIHPVNGSYDLSVTKEELGYRQFGLQLNAKERRVLNIELKNSISIEGCVLKLDETPHNVVPIQAIRFNECKDTESLISTTLTNGVGKYQFSNLKPGKYKIRCQIKGKYLYYSDEDGITKSQGEGEPSILQVEHEKPINNIDFRIAPFKKGLWRKYTVIDGLASMNVHTINEDQNGMLWFGTGSFNCTGVGVSRFDGKTFTNLTTEDGLTDDTVFAIHREPDGKIWFGTGRFIGTGRFVNSGGGISCYDGKRFINFTKDKDGLPSNFIRAICRDANGNLWFGTDKGVSRYDGKEFVSFTSKDGLTHNEVYTIYCDPDGILWFGTLRGVTRYDGKKFFSFDVDDRLANSPICAIHRSTDGIMWFGSIKGLFYGNGIFRYDGNKVTNITTENGLFSDKVSSINSTPDDILWFGTLGGVSRYDGKTFVNFVTGGDCVEAIHYDHDGALWFSTGMAGIIRYEERNPINLTKADGLEYTKCSVLAQAFYRDSEDDLWIGIASGILRYESDDLEYSNPNIITTIDGNTPYFVSAIYREPDGTMWFGTGGFCIRGFGLFKYNPEIDSQNSLVNLTTENGLAYNRIMAIHQDPKGIFWFATEHGISCYDGKRFINYTEKDGLVGDFVNTTYCDKDSILWFGTDKGISRYDGEKFSNLTVRDGLVSNYVLNIYGTPDGILWIGTGKGVSRYDGKRFINFTIRNGLPENSIFAINRSSDSIVWFGTLGGGVCGYDGNAWTSLDTRDGIVDNMVLSIYTDKDDSLWFGTNNGLTHYHRTTTKPKANIVSVTTDQTYYDLSEIPAFTIGKRITIKYNSIDFKTLPEKRQYRCRIREIDSNWQKPTKFDSFDIIFDNPGTYTFEVQAIDRDLNYSEPASLNLIVQPDPRIVSMQTELNHLRQEIKNKYRFDDIIGRSSSIKYTHQLMEKAIDSGLTVLITGETGTGKELVAKAIHYNSPRRGYPLLDFNCGAEPKELIASTLFGHRKGAFTGAIEDKIGLFESASGGTILLDEIGEMPQDAQVHLLRVLQERKIQRLGESKSREIDVRIIAMTNKDLLKEMRVDRFREDLYYRLSVFPIHIPPLRERPEDIPILAEFFLKQACHEQKKEMEGFAPEVMDMLTGYSWPGNVRELKNAVELALALAEKDKLIHTYHFPAQITQGESIIHDILSKQTDYKESMDYFARRLIERVLRESQGNRSKAARQLGMDPSNLRSLMRRLKIEE
jgi:DNA-binding NtrC family response regulator/ligand-binding sensor domain-containing protein